MSREQIHFLLLNIGHFLDHLFMLVFATVAALTLSREWGLGYGDLIKYATPGFFAFGLFALPAGWLADRWNRDGMMCVFFAGIGTASILTGFAQSPMQVGIGLFAIGVFAAIYHPVGLAIVTEKWKNTGMRIAVNGVWGNLGVASAALLTGYLIDNGSWRMAFIVPGAISIGIAIAYGVLRRHELVALNTLKAKGSDTGRAPLDKGLKALLIRVAAIVFLTAAVSSIVFQSTTFALPKIFDERLQGIAGSLVEWLKIVGFPGKADTATTIGAFAFIVFTVASFAQLVVGSALDRFGPRRVFMVVATIQLVFFLAMPGLSDGAALAVALGFMLGAFGQIPINDFMIGKMAVGEFRARAYGLRYVVSFTALAATLPLIALVYENWGFDKLFEILAGAALVLLLAASILPRKLPTPQ
jgi:MFS family permease